MRNTALLVLGVALCAIAPSAGAQPTPLPARRFDGASFPAHWPRAALLDAARAAANVDLAWERFGVLGRGATVCVVDTGVDLAHRDFRDASDATRVDWLLDLDASPRGSEVELEARFGGAVYRHDELDAMLAARDASLPSDWHGHGTAIASVAAGDDAPAGIEVPGVLAGVAPLARLIVVRALRRGVGGFADDDIVRGASFCAAVADPSRTVVVLSLGGHDGAHDGTSAIERALDGLVRAGLTLVVAAGNDGGRALHAAARVPSGGAARLPLWLPSPEEGTARAHVAVAVRGATDVAIEAGDGTRARVTRPGERTSVVSRRGRLTVDATRDGVVDVVVSGDDAAPLTGGDMTLVVSGPAVADAWIVSSELGASLFEPAFTGATALPGEKISMPATSEAVIAVGASVSRATLVTTDGSPALMLGADDTGRAIFSSRGPTAGGAMRPDVLAPGGWIVAARSSDVDPADPEALVHGRVADWSRLSRADARIAIAGTSASAAIVAGVLALAAERGPLDPRRDRERLAASAHRDDEVPFTPLRGFGALDALAFLSTAPEGAASRATMATSRDFTTPGAHDLSVAVLATTALGGVPDDAWITIRRDGAVVARVPLRAGVARAHVEVGRAALGEQLRWTAEQDDGTALASVSVLVVDGEDGSSAEARGGGGCTASGRRSTGLVGLASALVALALGARLRHRGDRAHA